MTPVMVSLVTMKEAVTVGAVAATPVPVPEARPAVLMTGVRMAMPVVRLVKVGIVLEVMKTVTHVSPLEPVQR